MRALLESLAGDGAVVSVRVPEHEVFDPLDERPADLVLLKSATDLALARAVAGEASGTSFLNAARATFGVHDKAATVARLAAAGLPVPKSFLFQPDEETVRSGTEGRWVVKPVRGVHGRGVSFHEGPVFKLPAEVEADGSFVADDGVRLLQGWVGGEEADVKVYVADGICFAGRKRFSASSYRTDEIVPVALDPETEGIVRAAGEALGLSCFGVDLRFDGEGRSSSTPTRSPATGVSRGPWGRCGRRSSALWGPRVAEGTQPAGRGGDGDRRGFPRRLAFGMVSFALPLYAYSLGLSVGEIGLLVSLRTVLVLPLKPVAGWLSDRIGCAHRLHSGGPGAGRCRGGVARFGRVLGGSRSYGSCRGQAPPGGR
jgi:hypothetical protein